MVNYVDYLQFVFDADNQSTTQSRQAAATLQADTAFQQVPVTQMQQQHTHKPGHRSSRAQLLRQLILVNKMNNNNSDSRAQLTLNATHLAQKLLLNSSSCTTPHHSSLPQLSSAGDASKKHRQQPTQSGKFPCTEPNCGKQFSSNADLKSHLRTHSNAKPFSCTDSGCSLEFNRRKNAIRHILNVHLKKKPADADKVEGEKDNNKPPDPATYLSVKEELL